MDSENLISHLEYEIALREGEDRGIGMTFFINEDDMEYCIQNLFWPMGFLGKESHVALVGFGYVLSFCLHLPSSGITNIYYHIPWSLLPVTGM